MDLLMPLEDMTYWHVLLVAGGYAIGWLLKNRTPLDNRAIMLVTFLCGATVAQFTGLADWLMGGLLASGASALIHKLTQLLVERGLGRDLDPGDTARKNGGAT